ncbi:pirin family protein [Azohydromonas caseinilytica]|uniref:Pirin family protein n=1 Tax=Azohydromonas caseinilytica TaxID=2728836 RepID=A0A848F278_9BURK|nr:pirin family protein [Azohydromonas caseinilytica]NML14157.1 pirin family protein [Azohydromonas caseinilytica]
MMTLRKSEDRGHADHGWLKSFHTFSFADYFDPAHMGFGNLRVINEDRIAPGTGFGTHGHRDMEILSYVLEGALAHKDSMGHAGIILPGEVQVMSAGRGVRHSEVNGATGTVTHFLQIWLMPTELGIEPAYGQRAIAPERKRGRLTLVAAPDAQEGALRWHADARLYAGCFDGDEAATLPLAPGRLGCVHVARGSVELNGQRLRAGDAAMLRDEARLDLRAGQGAEVLVFDLAP